MAIHYIVGFHWKYMSIFPCLARYIGLMNFDFLRILIICVSFAFVVSFNYVNVLNSFKVLKIVPFSNFFSR